jgi:hypothetical protein
MGYVQPTCVDISSSDKRVTFAETFTPSPSCKSFSVVCARLEVASITVTSGGSGYEAIPNVQIVGDGTATATATLGTGKLSSPVISNAGSGYTDSGPGGYTNVDILNGTGTGAKATVVVVAGIVTSVVLTNQGTGYQNGGSFDYNPDAADMSSTPSVAARIHFTTDYGTVASIALVASTQFTSVPTVIIAPPVSGSLATATAVMEDCPEVAAPGCSGDAVTIAEGTLALGEAVSVCGYSTPAQDTSYDVTENGNCLCDCTTATIEVDGDPGDQVRYYYNKCGLEERSGILTVGGSPSAVTDCIVPGSLVWYALDDGATLDIEYGDDCP